MPDDRTTATELGTALGALGYRDLIGALSERPVQLAISDQSWEHLARIQRSGRHAGPIGQALANGRALLSAGDGLRGRAPAIVEWTGGRRSPGDEVAPIDLRIDHVFLVSCKYESAILANASPARLFDGLLATAGNWDRGDWFEAVAADDLAALFQACAASLGRNDLPDRPAACTREQLAEVRESLRGRTYPDAASRAAYRDLCRVVSEASAARWTSRMSATGPAARAVLWRLLRIGSAPYFLLGNDRRTGAPARYRIADPWDWRDQFELDSFTVEAAAAGQPRVDWTARCRHRRTGSVSSVEGHVEIRWSHGRFSGPPEAKVYLDSAMSELPGYHGLEAPDQVQLGLWEATPPSTPA